MTKAIPQTVLRGAERIVPVSIEDARQLPNMLGRIAPLMLKTHGYYAATVDNTKTLYVVPDALEEVR